MGSSEVDKLRMQIDELKSIIQEQEQIIKSIELINSSIDLETLLNNLMNIVSRTVNSEAASVLLMDQEKEQLYFFTAVGEKKDELKKVYLDKNEGIAGWVSLHGRPLIVNDVTRDHRFAKKVDSFTGFTTKSVICVPLTIEGEIIGVVEAVNKRDEKGFSEKDVHLLTSLSYSAALAIHKSQLYQNLNDLFLGTVRALSSAIDAKDPYTHGHSSRVSKYSVMIAEELGLSKEEVKKVELAALLHDIGKIGIPERILRKEGKLTEEEYEEIKKHPTVGAEILSSISQLKDVIPAIQHHQERYDGKGYPAGLWNDNIPLYARIISVADTFDAMTSDRPYRKHFPEDVALKEIELNKGLQFDPLCVEAFIRAYNKWKKGEK
jgi:putative nucleotidyltransferase with HDIG domain